MTGGEEPGKIGSPTREATMKQQFLCDRCKGPYRGTKGEDSPGLKLCAECTKVPRVGLARAWAEKSTARSHREAWRRARS